MWLWLAWARDAGDRARDRRRAEPMGRPDVEYIPKFPPSMCLSDGDIYMDVVEVHRGRGFGSYLVQELKRAAYELGSIPAARCNPQSWSG